MENARDFIQAAPLFEGATRGQLLGVVAGLLLVAFVALVALNVWLDKRNDDGGPRR